MAKKKKNKKNSPLDLNQTLVQGAGISNYQYGGETSLSGGEWRGDLMTKPILDAMIGTKLDEKESETTGDAKKNTNVNEKEENKRDTGYEEYLKDINADGVTDLGEEEGVLSEEDWRELNEQNVEPIDSKDKNNKTKNTKTKNSKTKKGPKEVNVARKKGNVFGKLLNSGRYDKHGNKYVESNKTRRALGKEMQQAKKELGVDSEEYKDLKKQRSAKLYRVKRKGLFNDKTLDDAGLTNFFKNEGITDTGPSRSGSRTGRYYSPLEMNSREKYFSKTKRKNSQGNSPYAYKERVDDNTPFYQVEEVSSTNRRPEKSLQGGMLDEVKIEGNAFDLMEKYGVIDAKKYGNTLNLIGDEKPPQLLGRSASIAIDDFMKVQKEALYKAKTSKKGTSEENAIINNVKQLSTNMNNVGDFMTETFESTDQETESNGSSVANKYLRDIVFTQKTDEEGQPLTTMMVNNDHGLSIKFRDTEGTYTLDSLKENIFPKAFDSFEMLSKGMSTTKDEATSGMPFNETASRVLINNALKTEGQILSVIHDEESPLYQFLNDFAEGYPNANFDFAHIDSPNYNKEDLAPIVRDYALKKLRRQHSLYSNVKQNISTLSPEEIIKKFS
jgi:hypothetical protein